MKGSFSGKALLASVLIVIALNLAGVAFARVMPAVTQVAGALLSPGAWAIYSWSPLHYGSSYVMMVLVNVLFYYVVILATLRLKARLAR